MITTADSAPDRDVADGAPPSGVAPNVISLAIIDDNRLVREGLTALLSQVPGLVVVAAASSADPALLRRVSPLVILLDMGLRGGDSLRAAENARKQFPDSKIVVMDLLPAQEDIVEFVNIGVSGFIMKDATVDELVRTIRSVVRGEHVLPPQMTGTLFSQIVQHAVSRGTPETLASVRLTPREREVIDLIAEGLSNRDIAGRLHIATHTVKSHVRNIMEKLMLHNRLQIAAFVHKTGSG